MAYPIKFKKSRSSQKSKKSKTNNAAVANPFEKLKQEEFQRFRPNDFYNSNVEFSQILTLEKYFFRDIRDTWSGITNIFDDLKEAPEVLKMIRKKALDTKLIALNRPEKTKNGTKAVARMLEKYRDERNERERERLKNPIGKLSIAELFRRAQDEMYKKHLFEQPKK